MAAERIDEVRWRTVSPRAISQGNEGSTRGTLDHRGRQVSVPGGRNRCASQADSASSILVTRSTASFQLRAMISSLRRWRHDARLPFRARCVPGGLRAQIRLRSDVEPLNHQLGYSAHRRRRQVTRRCSQQRGHIPEDGIQRRRAGICDGCLPS
jgi:hypothetical protein